MKTRKGLYFLALVLIFAIIGILIFFAQAPKPPTQQNLTEELTYEEHLRTTPPQLENFRGSYKTDHVELQWDAPAPVTVPHDYGDTIILYKIYRGTTPEKVSSYASTKDLTFTDRAIAGSTQYAYEVTAVYEGGVESDPTKEVIVQVPSTQPEELTYQEHLKITPPPPRNLAGTFSGDRITLRWDAPKPVTVPHDYSDTITLYKIYRGTTPDTVSSYASTKDLTFTDRNLSGSRVFAYEVTALFGGEVESTPTGEVIVRITT